MSILKEIVGWAVTQSPWKQDAVRRIIKNGDFTQNDVVELSQLLLHEHGYISECPGGLKIQPIDKENLESFSGVSARKVILQKMEEVKNVNALVSDAKLQFAIEGLTIIYGENGVGKSGYSRILKKCCKSRDVDSIILPNVFSENIKRVSSAKISYSIDSENLECEWTDNGPSIDGLKELVVFDNKCGKIQVTDKNELIYLPHGTDIFKKLINLIIEVKKEIDKKKPTEKKINLDKIDVESSSYNYISKININSSKEDVETTLKWGEEEEKKSREVSKKIFEENEEEVSKKILKISKEMTNFKMLQETILTLEKFSTQDNIGDIYALVKNKNEARAALSIIASEMSNNNTLRGTGNELWRVMYEAAKEFSVNCAHPENKFPYAEGVCVLCQQTLDEEAKKRFEDFSKFAEGKIKQKYDDLSVKIKDEEAHLRELRFKIENIKNILELDYVCITEDNKKNISIHVDLLNKIRQNLIEVLAGQKKDSLNIKPIERTFKPIIEKYIEVISLKKDEAKESFDPENLKKLKKDETELNSLKIANTRINEVLGRISYLNQCENFSKMIKETDYASISRKGNVIITNSLKDNFLKLLLDELSKLGGMSSIRLFVKSSTKEGKPTFQLSLQNANIPSPLKIDSILSEGEQKIASLAGLLAEMGTAEHRNGLILDDPVVSLDHRFRRNIAKRLVEEAKNRQIIIFTHDIAFLFDLEFYAKELTVQTHIQNIRKEGKNSGIICTNPWHAQNVKFRLKTIRDDIDSLSKEDPAEENYKDRVGSIYGRLRETWERAVEEVLLNKVVMRFNQEVQTQRLNGVQVDDEDFRLVYFQMNKCSKYMIGHDKSLALLDNRPSIDEIRNDVERLSGFIKKIDSRKNTTIKEREKRVKSPPKAVTIN